MKIKDKIKSYSFWVSLTSAVILILKVLGNRFGFTVDEGMVSDLFTALCSILVLLGIIVVPSASTSTNLDSNTSTLSDTTKQQLDSPSTQTNLEVSVTPNSSYEASTSITSNEEISSHIVSDSVNENGPTYDETIVAGTEASKDISEKISIMLEVLDTNNPEEAKSETIVKTSETEEVDPVSQNEDIHSEIVSLESQDEETLKTESVTTISERTSNIEPISDLLKLKEMFNIERSKFSSNLGEYILQLQEEIRKAREQM